MVCAFVVCAGACRVFLDLLLGLICSYILSFDINGGVVMTIELLNSIVTYMRFHSYNYSCNVI